MILRTIGAFSTSLVVIATAAIATADATSDCINSNEKAVKLYADAKLTEALRENAKCAVASCPASITQACTSRADQINAAMPTIVFDAKDDTGNDLIDLKLTIDGVASSQATTLAFALNPGAHKFLFESTGRVALEKTYALRQGEKARREAIVLHDITKTPVAKVDPPTQSASAPLPDTQTKVSPPSDENTSNGTGQRVAGGIVAGVGLIGGAIIGGLFVAQWTSDNALVNSNCPVGSTSCTREAQDAANSAKGSATTDSYIFGAAFGVGGALLITGLIVFLTAPKGPSTKTAWSLLPSASPGGNGFRGLALHAEF